MLHCVNEWLLLNPQTPSFYFFGTDSNRMPLISLNSQTPALHRTKRIPSHIPVQPNLASCFCLSSFCFFTAEIFRSWARFRRRKKWWGFVLCSEISPLPNHSTEHLDCWTWCISSAKPERVWEKNKLQFVTKSGAKKNLLTKKFL